MSERSLQPDTDLVYDLFYGVFKPNLIRLALQLDVFTPLADGPATAQAVAMACACQAEGIQAMLEYLCSLLVLDQSGDKFSLTPTAGTFFIRGRKSYAGDLILHDTGPAIYERVRGALTSGVPSALGIDFVQDAWLESYRTSRLSSSLEMWGAAGIHPGPELDLRLLDIACGCAIKSLSLAQLSPRIRLTCLDTEQVLEVARDLAERMHAASQVTYLPGNLHETNLGKDCYEAALLGQISHYLTVSEVQALFRRICAALTSGGKLVIDCPMGGEALTEEAAFLSVMLWANSGGRAYTFDDYRAWLLTAGFGAVRQLGERWLVAQK